MARASPHHGPPGRNAPPSWRAGPGSLLLLFTLALGASASRADPTGVYEPQKDYYKAQGTKVTVRWELDRKTVAEGDSLKATLVVEGATNPHQVVRPDLRKLPAFDDFQVEDEPGGPVAATAKRVSFAYRLQPRRANVDRVPGLLFVFYNPRAPEGSKKYPTTKAEGVSITVTPAPPKPAAQAIPLDAPEYLFEVATGTEVLDREPFAPAPGLWLLLAAAGPLAAGGWYAVWRRLYPDALRLARIRRSRAARRAVDAIRRAGRSPDPAGTIAAAVLGYLRARYPLPPGAETPGELGGALRAAGLPESEADAAVEFFRRCDEARFAPPGDTGPSLAAGAKALVARLEERE
jgi:hypothetical protein